MRKFFSFILVAATLFSFIPAIHANTALNAAVETAAAHILETVENPGFGQIGGDWAVIGLARGEIAVPENYFERYYAAVEKTVRENNGVLHAVKYTEYSRAILGLTAAGFDPRTVAGLDLTKPLGDFEKTLAQGINGPVFALIALDAGDYPMPLNETAKTQATRELFINEILSRQTPDGGWNLTTKPGAVSDEKGDADITGMVLQALSNYQEKKDVKAATDKALTLLSELQDGDGGYGNTFSPGATAAESAVQVAVALCELGIPADDPRFVKNGYTVADYILSLQNADGSFKHTKGGDGGNQLSSEQALYGLVALKRAAEGKPSLYDMTTAPAQLPEKNASEDIFGLPGKHADVKTMPEVLAAIDFPDIKSHKNREAIEALARRGILSGRSESVFDPEATVSRAEFAAMITRALGLPEKHGTPFEDVPGDAWFAGAVNTAYYYEICSGVSPVAFNPNGTITRQEAAVMLARAAKLCGMDTALSGQQIRDVLSQFYDYRQAADWAGSPLAFCCREGIFDESETALRPAEAVRRCDMAEMIYQMMRSAVLL